MRKSKRWLMFSDDDNVVAMPYEEACMPEHTKDAIENYLIRGLMPGSFLTAVLAGELHDAVARADVQNLASIGLTAKWIATCAPGASFGSRDAVIGWCRKNKHFQQFQAEIVLKMLSTE